MRYLLLLLLAVSCVALAEEPVLKDSRTCYRSAGALSWPFRCELYEYKGETYLLGFSLQGRLWLIERQTPIGWHTLWIAPYSFEQEA